MTLLEFKMHWTGSEFGLFNSAYCWFNVFLFMLIIGGIVLDKIGVRLTGLLACSLMAAGAFIKYYAIEFISPGPEAGMFFGLRQQVFMACLGYAVFSMGVEICGITVSKVIVRWFQGRELALAMGVQVAVTRLGMALAMLINPMLVGNYSLSSPLLLALILLCAGLLAYVVFCFMDRRLDSQTAAANQGEANPFRPGDIRHVVTNRAFWLITLFCLAFYSAVIPFMKYAASFMENKYGLPPAWAGVIPALLPLANIVLTPLFGAVYDKKGKGASIMVAGAAILVCVHLMFMLPIPSYRWLAVALTLLLAVAFSMVPSALWPGVTRIVPEKQLGTAYALIFWVQDIGLGLIPLLAGWALDTWGREGSRLINGAEIPHYDYTIPMCMFMLMGLAALCLSLALKSEDRKKDYGLEKPNTE